MTELSLIQLCISKDPVAQRCLYEKYYHSSYSNAYRYLANHDDVEDVLSISFTKIFDKIYKFEYRGNGSLKKWINTIVINESLRLLDKSKMMFFNSDTELSVLTDESSDTDCLVSISDIYMIIESLPNDQRTVFNLFEIQGYSHSEITVKLRISVNNSKVILHRAKKRIQVIMLKDESYESR